MHLSQKVVGVTLRNVGKKKLVSIYCRCYVDFVSASLFNQMIMFTVT